MRSYWSYCDMSERITWSPTFRPSLISMVFTELRPNVTFTLLAYLPSGSSLKSVTVLFSCPNTGRPTNTTSSSFSNWMVPSTLRSGRDRRGQRAFQSHIHRHRAVQNGLFDARHAALDQPVARVDHRRLPDGDVLHLRFGDLQLGLQVGRLRHLAERRAGHHLLPFLDRRQRRRQRLQHPVEPRPHLQLVHLALLQLVLAREAAPPSPAANPVAPVPPRR